MNENQKNGSSVLASSEGGVWEQIFCFLKERIESPLIMTTVFAWLSVNTDFVMYLLFDSSSNKANYLANWNFSETIPFLGSFESFYSIWLPIGLGLVLTLTTRPVLLCVAGFRYFLSAKSYSFASRNKNIHDNAYEENQINKLITEKSTELLRLNTEINEKEDELIKVNMNKKVSAEHSILTFVKNSYTALIGEDLEKSTYDETPKFIESTSVITFKIDGKEMTLPIWEFIFCPEIGFFEDEDLFSWLTLKIKPLRNFELRTPLNTKKGVLEIINVRNVILDPF